MKKVKLLKIAKWLIKPFISRIFWYRILFITACIIFNIVMFEFLFKDISKSWIWFTGWVHCVIYFSLFIFFKDKN